MYAHIAYQTVENSTEDALYAVHHMGGKSDLSANVWRLIALSGTFLFDQGIHENGKVTLNNLSKERENINCVPLNSAGHRKYRRIKSQTERQ